MGKIWSGIKKVLGTLTDILLVGRRAGWWKTRGGMPPPPKMRDPRDKT